MTYIKKGAKQYKANLHSHTVLSDGKLTPLEMKKAYKDKGYSILAITDHERPYDHSDMTEKDFLMLTGYEVYIRTGNDAVFDIYKPEIHFNLIAKDPHNVSYIGFNEKYCKYIKDPAERANIKKVGSQRPREYSVEYVNSFVETAIKAGYLCAYNHPNWSMEDVERIMQYKGFFSIEMCNYGCHVQGLNEYNGALYNRILRKGIRMYTHSTDDNHNKFPFGHPKCDSFGGFTMVLADELTYESVIKALEKGDFYSSMGPVIKELTIEGDKVHVETSEALQIAMHFGSKVPYTVAGDKENPVTSASFVIPEKAKFVRISVADFEGRFADTRGYFRDEF